MGRTAISSTAGTANRTAISGPVAPNRPLEESVVTQSAAEDADLCVICMDSPKDATIVHEGSGHNCCCMACARAEQQSGRPCPLCRLPIEMVIKHFSS